MILSSSDPTTFGALLKVFRKRSRFTQQQLAAVVGVHRNAIGRWEQGDFLPEQKGIVLELAKHLHLDDQETRQFLEASFTAPTPVWGVPFPHNPFFTGREEILTALHSYLGADHHLVVALTQSYALHGLGGIGKTQIALEYAYRHAMEYNAVFWIGAETVESVMSSMLHITELLHLPEREETDQQRIVAVVQRWLTTHGQWLLIWDNLEDWELLRHMLSSVRQGAILITTRSQALGTLALGIDLAPMSQQEGCALVLRRAKVLGPEAGNEQMQQFAQRQPTEYAAVSELVTALGGLPLAMDQAGAYIEETRCGLSDYLHLYEQRRHQLLDRRGAFAGDHPQSVAATLWLACQRVAQYSPAALELLHFCAFLYPDAIPENLFVAGITHLGPILGPITADPAQFDQAIAALRSLSLVQRHPETQTLSLHRLVQAVLREHMSEQEQAMWLRRVICALDAAFPEVVTGAWGQCERLLPHALMCATVVPDQAGDRELVEVLRKAADYLRARAQYKQAELLYQRTLYIGEQTLGPEHPQVACSLNNLANLYYDQGKYELAGSLYQRALHIREQTLGPQHSEVMTTLNGLARLYWSLGMYQQAEPLYQRALHIGEQTLGLEHPSVATSLNGLAILLAEQGKLEQAEPLFEQALHIWERAWEPEHPRMMYPLNNLANLYYDQGKYEQAELLFQRTLLIGEQTLGPEHPQVAITLNNLANLYAQQEKYAQAEPFYQRALHIMEQASEPEHPQTAYPLSGLANLYTKQGKYTQAEPLYHQARRIREQALGPEHPEVASSLHELANLYTEQGRYEQAEALLERAIRIQEQALGPEHPLLAHTLNSMACLYRDQGKYTQAMTLFQRALHIREQQQHLEMAQTLHDLAIFHRQQHNLSEAISLAERALKIRSRSLGDTHRATVATLSLYAQLLQERTHAVEGEASEQSTEEIADPLSKEYIAERLQLSPQETAQHSRSENDPLQEFLTACCELHPRAWSRTKDLWQVYERWAEEHQERFLLSRRAFTAQLKAHGCRADRTSTARIWRGIAIVNNAP